MTYSDSKPAEKAEVEELGTSKKKLGSAWKAHGHLNSHKAAKVISLDAKEQTPYSPCSQTLPLAPEFDTLGAGAGFEVARCSRCWARGQELLLQKRGVERAEALCEEVFVCKVCLPRLQQLFGDAQTAQQRLCQELP